MGNQTPQPATEAELASRKALYDAGALSKFEDKFVIEKKGEGKFANAKPVHLAYFAIRALAELPILVLEISGYPYKCDRVGFSGLAKSSTLSQAASSRYCTRSMGS